MGTRRSWLVLFVLFLPAGLRADDHWSELSAAVSGAHLSNLGGFHFSGAVAVSRVTPGASPEFAKAARHWMAILDVSAHVWGKHDGADLDQITFGAGLRRTLVKFAYRKAVPFVQGTIGGALSRGSTLDGNRGALAIGGGVDIVAGRTSPSGKPKGVGHALRLHGDLVFPWSGEVNWYPRISIGYVLRIKET